MSAIRSGDADRFVARPPPETKLFLVFGSDSGLVRERARKLLRGLVDDPADPFQLVELDGDELAGDPLRLADEANTIPLFGGRRAVHVELGGKNILPALEPLLTAPAESAVLVEAGALKRDNALRKLFEKERGAAAIECSPDTAADVQRLINDEMKAAGLTLDDDARSIPCRVAWRRSPDDALGNRQARSRRARARARHAGKMSRRWSSMLRRARMTMPSCKPFPARSIRCPARSSG